MREDPTQTAGLEVVRTEIMSGTTALVASTLARTEVFRFSLTEDQKRQYREFFNRRNAIEQEVTGPIAEKAAEIRMRTKQRGYDGQDQFMKTPDAIHLATAIILKVDEFQTWDGTAKKPRRFPLLPLSGSSVVERLKIVVPSSVQLILSST